MNHHVIHRERVMSSGEAGKIPHVPVWNSRGRVACKRFQHGIGGRVRKRVDQRIEARPLGGTGVQRVGKDLADDGVVLSIVRPR